MSQTDVLTCPFDNPRDVRDADLIEIRKIDHSDMWPKSCEGIWCHLKGKVEKNMRILLLDGEGELGKKMGGWFNLGCGARHTTEK